MTVTFIAITLLIRVTIVVAFVAIPTTLNHQVFPDDLNKTNTLNL